MSDIIQASFPADAWRLLSPQLSESRRARFLEVVAQRTDHIRLVLADLLDAHNVSACMRSAEAMGILNIDIVQINHRFRKSTVSKGAQHWLDVHKYNSIKVCAQTLKKQGYALAAGFPPKPGVLPLPALPIKEPIAIIFGNEHTGLDAAWDEHLDYKFTIPMYGMVESFNISVSAAITLHETTQKARQLDLENFFIPVEKQQSLLNKWVCQNFRKYDIQLELLRSQTGKS